MTPLLLRAGWRVLTRYRGQWLLSVLAIALGVAVVVAVDLANQSALRAFEAAQRVLSGGATHQLVGGPEGVPEDVYRWLRIDRGLRRVTPVVEGRARIGEERSLTLLGLDPLAEGGFRGDAVSGGSGDIGRLIGVANTVLLSDALLAALSVSAGESVPVRIGGRTVTLTVVGRLGGDEPALSELAVVDIATAQDLLGLPGRLTRIDLALSQAEAERLAAALPAGLRLVTAGQAAALDELTAAFRLNLTALSLLALLVGLFLIYNTLSFAVVRRRPMVGTLRALGVTQRELMAALLLEAALLGLIGAVGGLLLGVPLAQGLVRLVGRTVEALYYEQAVLALVLEPGSLAKALLLGIAGAVAAAWLPARESAALPPRVMLSRSALEAGTGRWLLRAALIGAALAAGGVGTFALTTGLTGGFVGLFALVLGAALWVPLASAVLMGLAVRPLTGLAGTVGRLAGRGAVASLSRTGVAATALAVAVAAVVGVGIMIQSFRTSVSGWLEHTLRADVYVGQDEAGGGLPPALAAGIAALPEVAEVSVSRRTRLPTANGAVELWALDAGPHGWAGFQFLAGDPATVQAGLRGGGVIVSEPFAYRRRLEVGDRLVLPTREGARAFPLVGIYRDYGSDRGVVAMDADTLRRWFGDSPVNAIGVYAAAGHGADAVLAALRPLVAEVAGVQLRSQQALKTRSLEVFDQTFAITNVLRLLAAVVAFAGVLAALAALQLERGRENAVLRAIGFTPGQIARLTLAQSGLLGLTAGLCALPLGILLSGLLVHVILRRAFGWSMNFTLPPATLAEGVLIALTAAVVAALYPAWRSGRSVPAQTLREEA